MCDEKLETPIDKLWWFAQLERGVEIVDGEREPMVGSKEVVNRIAKEKEPLTSRDMFDVQFSSAQMGIFDTSSDHLKWPDPRNNG